MIYPTKITQEYLDRVVHLSDEVLYKDIADTLVEIIYFKKEIKKSQVDIDDRRKFVQFLYNVLDARKEEEVTA